MKIPFYLLWMRNIKLHLFIKQIINFSVSNVSKCRNGVDSQALCPRNHNRSTAKPFLFPYSLGNSNRRYNNFKRLYLEKRILKKIKKTFWLPCSLDPSRLPGILFYFCIPLCCSSKLAIVKIIRAGKIVIIL